MSKKTRKELEACSLLAKKQIEITAGLRFPKIEKILEKDFRKFKTSNF